MRKLFKIITVILAILFNLNQIAVALVPTNCNCKKEKIEFKLKTPHMKSIDIIEIQKQLKIMGLYKGQLDGIYGKETEKSVKSFQSMYGLEVDGIVGIKTLNLISTSYNKTFVEQISYNELFNITGEIAVLIDVVNRNLYVLSDNKIYKHYPVAVGKWHTPTPVGTWKITNKASWGEGFGTRWLGLNVPWGIYGIHGTNKPWSIGSYASGGCIRMHNSDVEELYKLVKIGTPVIIVCEPYGPFTYGRNVLHNGSRGSDVMEVQKRLKGLGFYQGNIDGIFGWGTETAVKEFQKSRNLIPDGFVTAKVYDELGILLFE